MLRLDGKVAFVTGCGTAGEGWGNGKAISVLLARQGAMVYGVDRNLAAANVTRDFVLGEGGVCQVSQCDVTDSAQVATAVAACKNTFGAIDILVNNVGLSEPGGPVEIAEDVWDQQIDVNLKSVYLTLKHVLPDMEKSKGGAVVNISSVAGIRYIGKPQVAYSASKAALEQLTRTTAVIYAPHGVRLNCVAPGLMFTPLVSRLADKYAGGKFDEFVAHRNAQVPMGHMGDAWDVAHAALFLVSGESKYITGQTVVVDGGFTSATR